MKPLAIDIEDPFPNIVRQSAVFCFSLLDDLLVVLLSRLGCHISWLEWLSPVVMGCTGIYLLVQFGRSAYAAKLIQVGRESGQAMWKSMAGEHNQ
ncbi:hypothetical protein [Egbenema bharatensis]|uniref:hypothetical protein n=1 Tax=Egbenema bharatensis TaxID=3463334 RepID=UPI003A87F699